MDANQRSEMNNQTNNGGNEKWNANAKGKTAPDAPLDHTYPQGASQQQGRQGIDQMGTQQSGMGPGPWTDESSRWDLPGGSMQTQQSGGSGPTQSITDSHQRQMEQHSQAWGELEQPVGGHRAADSGVSVAPHQGGHAGNAQAASMNPQDPRQPELQGGSLGHHHGVMQPTSQSASQPTLQPAYGGQAIQSAQQGNSQHAEALPRSPARERQDSTDRAGSQTGSSGREAGTEDVHESNDAAGGYPRSPGGANRLAGDSNMDDDTGFKRK